MQKIITTLFIFFFCSFIWAQKTSERILKKSFRKDSQELLIQFFDNWSAEIPPISKGKMDGFNDTIQNIYSVFQEFYSPQNLNRIGGCEFGEIYQNTQFYIVQNRIEAYLTYKIHYKSMEIDSIALKTFCRLENIQISDTASIQKWNKRYKNNREHLISWYGPSGDFQKSRADSLICKIDDFRPIGTPDSITVYLTDKYNSILNDFLGELNYGKNPKADKKQNFLRNQIFISQGLNRSWHLLSYPFVRKITFDETFQYAEIEYRILHEGGVAILKNNEGKWKLISAERTWIE